jgi:hypothetical protein
VADITDLIFEDHQWFRRQFFYLDDATTVAELTAIWEPLATRLDTHADAEEQIFYPALLKRSEDPEEETEDAIGDHNKIRDAVAATRRHEVGSDEWWEAVTTARKENGEHLDEEEREGLPDFRRNATARHKHDLAMRWLRFSYEHPLGRGVDDQDKDAQEYIAEHS